MISRKKFSLLILSITLLVSCNSGSDYDEEPNSNKETENMNSFDLDGTNEDGGCGFEDDNYSATVYYKNSETGYSATYTLDVEVADCQIVQINFPNDGHLDEDHISFGDLDEEGSAFVYGEDGKTYEINIH